MSRDQHISISTAISIASYLGMINVNVSSQKKGAKALHSNEFYCKIIVSVESFWCLMLTATLKGNLVHCVMFLQIGPDQYLTFFC